MFESHKYHIQLQQPQLQQPQQQWSYERLYIMEEGDTDVAHNVQMVQMVQTIRLAFTILNK